MYLKDFYLHFLLMLFSMWEDRLLICSLGLYCSMVVFLYQVLVIVITFTFFLSKAVPHFPCILCLRFLFTDGKRHPDEKAKFLDVRGSNPHASDGFI